METGTVPIPHTTSEKSVTSTMGILILITSVSPLSMTAWRHCRMSVSTSSALNSVLSDPRLLWLWENAYRHMLSQCAHFPWWHLQSLCPVQVKVSPAQFEISNIVHDIRVVYDIVYDARYNDNDIGIRYRIPITNECYVLVFSGVFIMPLFTCMRTGQINGCTRDVISGLFRVRVLAEGFSA
jgi:hypothetical protein